MDRIKYLILAFLREELSPAEEAELEQWRREDPANEQLVAELQDPAMVAGALAKLDQLHRQEAWAKVELHAQAVRAAEGKTGTEGSGKGRVRRMRWVGAGMVAASIGIVVVGTWLLVKNNARQTTPPKTVAVVTDVQAPVTIKATLYLANGQRVVLDSVGKGLVARQGGARIEKSASGLVAYVPAAAGTGGTAGGPEVYNTLSNPRGSRVVTVSLADGTKVWLNAESSITYPAAFDGRSRRVTMTGEAYFEVARDVAHPFIVRLPAVGKGNREDGSWMDVEVLGTAFNVNAYNDEGAARTTLVEGSVKVSASGTSKIITPGEETAVTFGGPVMVNPHADTGQALAWKNGRFSFAHSDLKEVMRQLSRWYDVDVSYEGEIPERHFSGRIGRTLTLDQVLRVLTSTRVHYTIGPGNKLVIKP